MTEHILNFATNRFLSSEECDAWQAEVNQEVLAYLKHGAGDKYDPDGTIYGSVKEYESP